MGIFEILGNKNRRKILEILSKKPMYVTELSRELEINRKAVIDHLKALKREKLINELDMGGNKKYYKISNNLFVKSVISEYFVNTDVQEIQSPKKDAKEIKKKFKEIDKIEKELSKKNKDLKTIFELIRELENFQNQLFEAEKYASYLMNELRNQANKKIEKKVEKDFEKEILIKLVTNGQISPEKLSNELKINKNKVYDLFRTLKQKNLI
ncbi:MAG: Transcriptional regulator ArsR family [Candidatus Methanohalarchaeum thermophilum]|uniref:Transcriptional regulator ArsR family n=1 Tax=Methanohalarchaeum thermophilum TaxID=1903181 RepID=A0A1Q6DUT3_METT1|nr:MAG: Transcriptional regulator ArsR family [Candidatus Methanohalarchaeum thermophilum]